MSTPALRLRVSPQFPINVTADAGLGASITRNTLSIRNNWEGIGKTTPPSLVNYSRLVYNETLGTYERISELTTFAGGTLTTALNEAAPVTLASAGIVNIGAANANTITITGVTAITGFDTIPAGAVRRLIFASALTLTHNAISLILPTGANITTAAGDAFVFLSLGSGNWRCMDYQLASGAALAVIIPDSSITSAKIADGTIVDADIADGTITPAKFASTALATQAETNTGTDATKIVTPARLRGEQAPSSAKSAGYTVLASDNKALLTCTNTFTLALTAAATLGDGFTVDVYNSGSGNITIDPNASETINGQPTAIVYPNGYLQVRCTGTAWTALGIDNNPAYNTPLPKSSTGVGQWVGLNPATGAGLQLPAGGSWAYAAYRFNLGVATSAVFGVNAGGTVLDAGVGGQNWQGFAWRVT